MTHYTAVDYEKMFNSFVTSTQTSYIGPAVELARLEVNYFEMWLEGVMHSLMILPSKDEDGLEVFYRRSSATAWHEIVINAKGLTTRLDGYALGGDKAFVHTVFWMGMSFERIEDLKVDKRQVFYCKEMDMFATIDLTADRHKFLVKSMKALANVREERFSEVAAVIAAIRKKYKDI